MTPQENFLFENTARRSLISHTQVIYINVFSDLVYAFLASNAAGLDCFLVMIVHGLENPNC